MKGFTIIEVLVVAAILGILVAVVSPHIPDEAKKLPFEESVDCDEPTIENKGGLLCDRS